MTKHAKEILRRLDALDAMLVERGFPPMSPFWRSTFRRLYESGRRQLVARVGRRGGKSSSLCRLAVVVALYGTFAIPPGDLGVVAFISTTRDEAAQRLRTIKTILDVLGEKYRPIDGGIELAARPVAFKVFTGSVSGVSGFTSILVIADEVAKWKDADTGSNPATEVLRSVRPTMATQPEARIILSSSPFATLDAHFDAFEQGDTDFQVTAHAATWEANPTLTEADTHALEPNEDVHRREYRAIPQTELETSLLTSLELDRVTRDGPLEIPFEAGHEYCAATDPASRVDSWTFVIATKRRASPLARVRGSIVFAKEWKATRSAPLSPDAVAREMATICERYRVTYVWRDQHGGDFLDDVGRRHGLDFVEHTWTAASKLEAYESLRTRIADEAVELPPHAQLRADLLGVQKRITRNGFTIELPRVDSRHCDFAPAVAIALNKFVADPPPIRDAVDLEAAVKEKRRLALVAMVDREERWRQRRGSPRERRGFGARR